MIATQENCHLGQLPPRKTATRTLAYDKEQISHKKSRGP